MYHLVYTSTATIPFTPAEMQNFLMQWRVRNRQRAITGMLLYSEGEIMQVLEGEQPIVEQVFALIEQDLRHRNVTRLAAGPTGQRMFRDWSMSFRTLDRAAFDQLVGTTNPDQYSSLTSPVPTPDDDQLLHLLREFAALGASEALR